MLLLTLVKAVCHSLLVILYILLRSSIHIQNVLKQFYTYSSIFNINYFNDLILISTACSLLFYYTHGCIGSDAGICLFSNQ